MRKGRAATAPTRVQRVFILMAAIPYGTSLCVGERNSERPVPRGQTAAQHTGVTLPCTIGGATITTGGATIATKADRAMQMELTIMITTGIDARTPGLRTAKKGGETAGPVKMI